MQDKKTERIGLIGNNVNEGNTEIHQPPAKQIINNICLPVVEYEIFITHVVWTTTNWN